MRIHLAIDESYARPGFAVVNEKQEILYVASLKFPKKFERWEKRIAIGKHAQQLCEQFGVQKVIVERVRLFSNYQKKKRGISLPTIDALSKINGQIVCTVAPVPVFSADTHTWKTAMLSGAPPIKIEGVPDQKASAVWYMEKFYHLAVDHDAADACLIGLYSFTGDLAKEL